MSQINQYFTDILSQIEFCAIRAQGSGGQNVNKVSSAVQLRFDIPNSCLPHHYKSQLLSCRDSRVNNQGVLVIKAQCFRTQEQNKQDAIERLEQFLTQNTHKPKKRISTKPTKGSQKRRVDAKVHRGKIKATRGKSWQDS